MQNLIDDSFFWGELELGNLFKSKSGILLGEAGANSENELNMFIAKYQKEYLEQMFGEDLAKDLPEELQALIVDNDTKTSPIASYVYYFVRRAKDTVTTAMGEKKLNAPNTILAAQNDKLFRAMSDCIKWSVKVHTKLYDDENITVTIDGEETELNYLNDIYPNISITANIFDESFNQFGI